MLYVLYIVGGLYAVLCIVAAAAKAKQWKTCPSLVAMLVGGLGLGNALVLKSSGFDNAWILALAALVCIAVSAWKNAAALGKRHVSHHLVRWAVSALLLAGFVFL